MPHKSGFVSIIGKPNSGKSTLMNALIGEKLSIITSKPQTTRKRILGILSSEDFQIIFLDTPGILNPEYLMQERMLDYVYSSVKDSDIILFLIDVSHDPTGNSTLNEKHIAEILQNNKANKILILNKIDLSEQPAIEALINDLSAKNIFDRIIPISASKKFNIATITDAIIEFLPDHPKYYPDDQISDASERFFVSEIIREKVFELFKDEVPYSTEILIAEFKERENAKAFIGAEIVVEKESQKPIILGAKGEAIKRLGKAAREAIEEFLKYEVYLELRVKVREKWRSDPNLLKSFGYTKDKE